MTSISKIVYIDKLDDIVNKYNNTYYRTIKMKPSNVNPNKACLFEGSFYWGRGGDVGQFDPLHISRRTCLISIQLYTIAKQSI